MTRRAAFGPSGPAGKSAPAFASTLKRAVSIQSGPPAIRKSGLTCGRTYAAAMSARNG